MRQESPAVHLQRREEAENELFCKLLIWAFCTCLVVSGTGRSTIGEHSFDWSQHDVFSIPHWNFASHTATGGDAEFFIVSDKVAFERLDLLREELQ